MQNDGTLGTLRKQISLDVASDVTQIVKMFAHICENNPEAVKAAFGSYLSKQPTDKQDNMVRFYADNADYLLQLFNLK